MSKSKLVSRSSKSKSKKSKRIVISPEHAKRIARMRKGSTKLRRRFIEDMTLHKFSSCTQERYLSAAIHFCAYFWKSPVDISDDEIRAYLNYQTKERHLGNGSMGIIHGALLFLYDKTLRQGRPTLNIFRTKKDSPEKVILSQAEVRAALRCVRDIRYRTALELIYCCGLRETEALNLKLGDVDYQRGLLSILGKGHKRRQVPLPERMAEKLQALWESHRHPELFFPAYHSHRRPGEPRSGVLDRPIHAQTLLNVFQQAVTESGSRKKINIHTLRHCYCCHMLEEGAPLQAVKNNLGHRSLSTTAVYAHYTTKIKRAGADAVEKLADNLSR